MQPANNNLAMTPELENALASFGVDTSDVVEAHPQKFWDIQAYPAAGKLAFKFFQNTPGQNGTTQFTTNMPGQGQFPNPQNFLWTATEIVFLSGQAVTVEATDEAGKTQADDYNAVMLFGPGTYGFSINTKQYLFEGPLGALPAQFGQQGSLALSQYDQGAANVHAAAIAQPYGELVRTSGQLITSNMQISGSITFDALAPTASAIDGKIGVRLHGIWYQMAQ